MRNNVSGEVRDNGTVVQVHQVHGDILLHKRSSRRQWITPARTTLVVRTLLALLLLAGEQYAFGALGDNAFPAGESFRPTGVDEDNIAQMVVSMLRRCTAEVVAAPANCPQREVVPPGAYNIQWQLVGDPRNGMRIRWYRDRFYIGGAAVMTLSYETADRFSSEVSKVPFNAELTWRDRPSGFLDDRPRFTERIAVDIGTRQGFELTELDFLHTIHIEFLACTTSTFSPMAPGCPRTSQTPVRDGVKWTLDGDPLKNWRVEEDAMFGLVDVIANYSATLYDRDGARLYIQSGTYVATLVREGDSARLLEIKHVP